MGLAVVWLLPALMGLILVYMPYSGARLDGDT